MTRVDYRTQKNICQSWAQAVDSRKTSKTQDPSEHPRKRSHPEADVPPANTQPAASQDREYERMEALISKMERRFVELVDLARE